ncbi:PREDICTED: uncharacterized protein LOC107094247 [Cyprinodon variegatus]|uniref:uncharacterized protein LOC107094247 n=1 Tax=Cyprinodon variegatus TaxID=28743 RepID=UPI00074265A0|nr:PREDICTED: uncharacterized protein LOC107094247 [Cyprinodon variegatus]
MFLAHLEPLTWSSPHLLRWLLACVWLLAPPTGVSADLCRVTGGVLGIHWTSTLGLGWYPLASGRGGATCWETCCLEPRCDAVWSIGGRCVLLSCSRKDGCSISSLPQPHEESLGLLQLLSKGPVRMKRRKPRHALRGRLRRAHLSSTGSPGAVQLAPTALSRITVPQTAQQNLRLSANGSSDGVLVPPLQNSTVHSTINPTTSSNITDGSSLTPAVLSHPCLLQLTVGLYEFEVTVEGEGARGRGYVNVTVRPGESRMVLIRFFCSVKNLKPLRRLRPSAAASSPLPVKEAACRLTANL